MEVVEWISQALLEHNAGVKDHGCRHRHICVHVNRVIFKVCPDASFNHVA